MSHTISLVKKIANNLIAYCNTGCVNKIKFEIVVGRDGKRKVERKQRRSGKERELVGQVFVVVWFDIHFGDNLFDLEIPL